MMIKVRKYTEFTEIPDNIHKQIIIASSEFDIIPNPEKQNFNVGIDLYVNQNTLFESKGTVKIVPTGVKVCTPLGIYASVKPRSSMPLKTPFLLANSEGVIDPNYRGDIGLILYCRDDVTNYILHKGTRVAQICFMYYLPVCNVTYDFPKCIDIYYFLNKEVYEKFEELFPSDRGSKGYGSTGGY